MNRHEYDHIIQNTHIWIKAISYGETNVRKDSTLTSFELRNPRVVTVSTKALLVRGAKLSRIASDHDFRWAIPSPFTIDLGDRLALYLAKKSIFYPHNYRFSQSGFVETPDREFIGDMDEP